MLQVFAKSKDGMAHNLMVFILTVYCVLGVLSSKGRLVKSKF